MSKPIHSDSPCSHNNKLIFSLCCSRAGRTIGRIDIHRDWLFTKFISTRLKTIIIVFLVLLVYPKSGQVSDSVNSKDKVGVAVKQFDNSLLEVSDGTHFKIELFIFTQNVHV